MTDSVQNGPKQSNIVQIGLKTSKKEVFVEQPRLHRVRLPSYRVSRKKLGLGKTTFYTKIQKSAIKMTFQTIIAPKNTEHYVPSSFRFTNQKSPKITLYQINLGQNPKIQKSKKRGKNQRISIFFGGERSRVIQSGHKLSNLFINDQIHAKKDQERPKMVLNRPKLHWKGQYSKLCLKPAKTGQKKDKNDPQWPK